MPLTIPFFSTNNGRAPRKDKGPQLGRVTFDWSAATSYSFDLTTQAIQAGSDTIQAMFIDNSLNPSRVVLQFPATLQRVVIPRYSQGTVPILGKITGLGGISSGSATVPNSKTIVFFLDVPMPFHVWSAKGDNLQCNQAVVTLPAAISPTTLLLAANPARRGFEIYNFSATVGLGIFFQLPSATAGQPSIYTLAQTSVRFFQNDPCYTGPISGAPASAATINVNVFEFIDDGLPTTLVSAPPGGNPGQ